MCNICIDYQKGLLTKAEAQRNLGEFVAVLNDPKMEQKVTPAEQKHLKEVQKMLDDDQSETD